MTPRAVRFRGTPLPWAQQRPPVVRGPPVGAETPDVYRTLLVWREDFTGVGPIVPTAPPRASAACPVPRPCVPRCLQTRPREDTLALPVSCGSTDTGTGDLHPEHDCMHSTHASGEPRPMAGATQERKLWVVGSTAWLGGYAGRQWYSTSGADSGAGLRPNLTARKPWRSYSARAVKFA